MIPQQEVKKEENITQAQPVVNKEQAPIVAQTPATQAPVEESPQDRDWRKWKENRAKEREQAAKEKEARERAEKEAQALKAALEAVVNKPSPQATHDYYNSNTQPTEETEEERIEKKVAQALAKREAEYAKQRAEEDARTYPQKLVDTFKDFNQVCTTENMDYLEFHHPELTKSLGARPQGFEKWADVYSAIKRYIPNPESSKEAKKADNNLKKPQSLSNSGLSNTAPAGAPVMLDEARRKANWERMQRTIKGLS